MATSKELAPAGVTVPDLVQPSSALEIDQNDVILPRLKLGQPASGLVQESIVPAHCIYSTVGQDDPDPTVLYELGDEEGLLVHVLAMRKGWSLVDDDELLTWTFDDPNRDKDAWLTYHYVLALPEAAPYTPHKMLFTKTGKPAAQNINTVLSRSAAAGPSFMSAFRITTVKREKQLGTTVRWTVPQVRSVDATQDGVDVSATLYQQIASSLDSISSTTTKSDEPAI